MPLIIVTLTIVLLILKLVGLNLSWWWVAVPVLVPAFILLTLFVCAIIAERV